MASGEALGCYGLTEPGSGSDPASLVTRAVRDGDEWVIDGSKIFITLGSWAGVALVFARTGGEGPRGHHVLSRPDRFAGLQRAEDRRQARAARAGHGGALLRRRARAGLGPARRRGRGVQGRDVGARQRTDLARGGSRRCCAGCVDASVAYASERTQFGKPLAQFQLIQELIADMAVETEAARHDGVARGRARRSRRVVHAGRVAGEVLRERGRRACGERRAAGARRLRLRRRVPGRALSPRRARR